MRPIASIFLNFKKPLSRLAQKILHRIRFFVVLVVVLLTVATTVRVMDPFLVSALRQLTFDWYQRLHPESYDPDSPVRIVDIDEASLSKIGQWPWPRTVLGDLLADLADKGAAAVGFDVLFVEPDRSEIPSVQDRAKIGADIYGWYQRHASSESLTQGIAATLGLSAGR